MKGITFGNKHRYNDFGLILSQKEIGFPEPKTEYLSIIGRDGDIDLTTVLCDEVKYGNRILTFVFSMVDYRARWAKVCMDIAHYLHGQEMKIILDEDKTFYYLGRCKINSYQSEKAIGKMVIECNVLPYKTETHGAGEEWKWDEFSFVNGVIHFNKTTMTGSPKYINLIGRKKNTSPTFICTAPAKATFGDTVFTFSKAGTYTIPEIKLIEGANQIKLEGNSGTITIKYEGKVL